jgi:hypothetical protein
MNENGSRPSVLLGLNARRLDDADDLVALHPLVEQDWLTRFVRRYFQLLFVVVIALCLNY